MNFKIIFIVNNGKTLSEFFKIKKSYFIKNSKRFLVLFLYQKKKKVK
jgi:hypothetical protein